VPQVGSCKFEFVAILFLRAQIIAKAGSDIAKMIKPSRYTGNSYTNSILHDVESSSSSTVAVSDDAVASYVPIR